MSSKGFPNVPPQFGSRVPKHGVATCNGGHPEVAESAAAWNTDRLQLHVFAEPLFAVPAADAALAITAQRC
jgi:hypothetical protein